MVKGQRWKVGGLEIIAREGAEEYSRILPEVLPSGAVVEEEETKGNRLRFTRLSGRGPYTGWVDIKDGKRDLLYKVEKKSAPGLVVPTAVEDDLDGTNKRKKGEQKSPRPQSFVDPSANLFEKSSDSKLPRPGRFWKVVGAGRDGLKVWQGVSETSSLFPGTLPQGAVVEEVQVVGNRLSFTDFSMRGPPSGWVNLRENGRDMLVIDTEGLSTVNIAEALRESAGLSGAFPPANVEPPLSGWAKLSEMYQKPEGKMDVAAAAAETDDSKKRRKRRTVAAKEMPKLEELAHATEETLVDVLGFPEQEAKHFAMLNGESKQRVITECRALIDMSPLERQEAFEKLRKAWPQGPFPSFAKPTEHLPPVTNNLLPKGTCFPLKRPSIATQRVGPALASALDGKPGFFAPEPMKNGLEQKKALQSLAPSIPAQATNEVAPDPSIATMDLCRLPSSKPEVEKLSKTVMMKGRVSSVDVASYLSHEMRTRPIILDSGPGAKLLSAKLSEAEYRGERAKVLRDSASQMGNVDLLSLSKGTLVSDTHKDYLKNGVDICCTNTLKSNSFAQKEYKTAKLVTEMNKAAALLAKRATAEVTKQDMRKPRFVAGLVGSCEVRCSFDDMVEAYSEQIKGLAEGGVDLLSLEMPEARSAKAAIVACQEVYRQMKQRVPPLLIHAIIDPATGRTMGGQTADAFYISVKHARPLAVGVVGSAKVSTSYGQLLEHCQCFNSLKSGPEAIQSLKDLPNFVGLGPEGLPSHLSALSVQRPTKALPEATKKLMLSGLESRVMDGFTLVGQRGSTRAYGKFKELMDDFKSNGRSSSLSKALDLCAADNDCGADVLDICVDGVANDGTNRGSKVLMNKFTTLCDGDARVAKSPAMICSSDWKVVKEGLGNLQGRCVVNAICLMVGEDEFLQLAKETMKYGAALVVMAIGEQGRAVTSKDKVALLQRSYRLLRQKLDFPAEDIILDCHLQTLRHDEHPSEVLSAISDLRRSCPYATVAVGLSNLSAAFGQMGKLREALHSTFLQHAIPKGLSMALAPAGRLPLYSTLEPETRNLCEEVVLNSKSAGALQRFMAFLNFRSGNMVCLPLQAADESAQDAAAWWNLPECKAAGMDAQKPYLEKRGPLPTPAQQKAYWSALKPAFVSAKADVMPEKGCERPSPCRVAGGTGAIQQQVMTALQSGTAIPYTTALAQLNAMLSRKVLVTDGPLGPAEQLGGQDEAAFRGAQNRFPATAKNNLELLSITKPDLVLTAHRALLKAGADIIRTNTRNGDGLCQAFYGTEDATYELNKAAAGLAKQAVTEAMTSAAQPKFVAGVVGPSTGSLSSPKTKTTWDEMVNGYRPQVRGLVEGGVHLLLLDMVSDTLNAKAAVYAIKEYFDLNPTMRLPLLINVSLKPDGRTPSGQSLEACIVSLLHAQPLAFGIGGDGATPCIPLLSKMCSSWIQWTGVAPQDAINFYTPSSSKPKDVQDAVVQMERSTPRALPSSATETLRLSNLDAVDASGGLKLIGQRCHVQGSHRFKGLVHACKYTSDDDVWEAALDVAIKQVDDNADLLDLNFDSPKVEAPSAMGKFVRRCSTHPKVAKVPLVISSMSWKVIAEGLKNTQGKCIVNGLSVASSEEEFLRAAEECRRFGAAVIVLALPKHEGGYPTYQEKVESCQRAYQLLRGKLDFAPSDIIFDCLLTPVGSEVRASVKDFIDAVAEVKRTCPGVSFTAGVSNLSHGARTAAMLREALASAFLQHAVPKGLNFAFVELGHLPRLDSIEEPTKSMCMELMNIQAPDGPHVSKLLNFAAFLSGSAAADEAQKKVPKNTLQRKDKSALVPVVQKQSPPEPLRPSPQFKHPVETLVQATGTVSSSIFQTFGSKAHAAANYHRLITATTINRTVHFSSISVYMGQGGSGPVTGASGVMDGLSLWERHQGINQYSTTVLWGAIGEIGLRKAIYGSRDVFAQFDLGQKLIGPADTAFLEKAVCLNPSTWDFVGLAYLDNTWQDSLSGRGATTGLQGRKSFVDNS